MRLNDSEWTVMNALWDRSPASGREVLEQVCGETAWAYSTVKTILSRLLEKGAVRMSKRANTSLYEPLVSQDQARRSALHSLVDRAFDGTFGSLFQHMVAEEKLSKKDREKLEAMLNESRGTRR